MYKSVYKSVCWKRTAPVLRVLLRMHSEARTRQAQRPAASRCVRRLNIAARNLGSFQIRGHNGVMSPVYPKAVSYTHLLWISMRFIGAVMCGDFTSGAPEVAPCKVRK